MVSTDTKSCAHCREVRLRDTMMPFIDEGVLRHACGDDCHVAFVVKKNADKSREQA